MGITSKILDKFGYAKTRSTTSNPAQWFIDWVTGGTGAETSSGLKVNAQSALKYTPFWAAVRIISSTVAELPFKVYSRRKDGGKDSEQGHRVHQLLDNRPNEYMDALTFRETRQAQVLTYGNSYAEIQRDGGGRPVALWPILPNMVTRKIKDGVPYYQVRTKTGQQFDLLDYNVLHIKGLGFDGYTGYNVVAYHKEAIGYGVAVKQYGARFFSNDGSPGGVLEHPKSLSDEAYKHLQETWAANHTGLTQAHRMAILEEGMKWKQQGVDPKQAQSLEVQKYTVDDCSRIFQIPPHMLGSMDRATFNNIEEQNMKFISMTMLYWFKKWEEECNYKLFMPSERSKMFCEILVDALLRGNIKARYEAYNIGRNGGWLNVDEIREKENMNPLPDGKGQIYLQPLNMKEAGTDDPGNDPDTNSVRQSHRDLIIGQMLRIIRKQNNATKKVIKPEYYDGQRAYAKELLFDPVNAYASTRGISVNKVRQVVDSSINDRIRRSVILTDNDAEIFADRIMKELGGNHAG